MLRPPHVIVCGVLACTPAATPLAVSTSSGSNDDGATTSHADASSVGTDAPESTSTTAIDGSAGSTTTALGEDSTSSESGSTDAPPFRRLWLPHYGDGELRAWDAQRLAADVDGAPDRVVTLPAGAHPNAIAFADDGSAWVTDDATNRLYRYDSAELERGGRPAPAVQIDSDGSSLIAPIDLAYDGAGMLWVAASGRLEGYAPDALDQSGPTTPSAVVEWDGFDIPAGLELDASGNLWVTNASFAAEPNAVLAFTPAQLDDAGEQTPRLELRSDAFALVEGLVFDDAGALWVSSNDGFVVSRFAAEDVALPDAPELRELDPIATLVADDDDSASGRSVRKPGGLVIDADGRLWVNSERGDQGTPDSAVLAFTAAQLDALDGAQPIGAEVLVAHATSNPGYGGLALQLD